MIVKAGSISASLLILDEDGLAVQPDATGSVRLTPNGFVSFTAQGYATESALNVWLMSDPMLIGTTVVDSNGNATGRFSIGDKVPAGEHRIVLEGLVGSGTAATLSVGVYVDGSTQLSAAARVAIAVPVIGAIFFALLLPARRRTRRRQPA